MPIWTLQCNKTEGYLEKDQDISNHCHWTLLMKRLPRYLPSQVLKVSKEEGSKTSHTRPVPVLNLNYYFFSLYSAGVFLTAIVPSCPFTFKQPKTPASHILSLPCSRLGKAHVTGLPFSQALQPPNIFTLSSSSCPAGRAKNWAQSSGRNLNRTKWMGNDTNVFWRWQSAKVVDSKYDQLLNYAIQVWQQQLHHQHYSL